MVEGVWFKVDVDWLTENVNLLPFNFRKYYYYGSSIKTAISCLRRLRRQFGENEYFGSANLSAVYWQGDWSNVVFEQSINEY